MCKKIFAKKSNRDRHIRQFHGSQFQVSDNVSYETATDYNELNNDVPTLVVLPRFFPENVSDGIATDRDKLNNDVPAVVAPTTRSGLENEIIDFNISVDTRRHQLVNSAQADQTMKSPNSNQQITRSIKLSNLERTVDSIRKMQVEFLKIKIKAVTY